jgi:hypothetical protein
LQASDPFWKKVPIMKKTAAVKQCKAMAGDDPRQKKKKPADDTEVSNDETSEEDPSHNESDKDDSEVSCVNLVNFPLISSYMFKITPLWKLSSGGGRRGTG